MMELRLRIRESRLNPWVLSTRGDGSVVFDVPANPIKDDRGTVVFAWQPPSGSRLVVKVYGRMGVLNWLRKQVVGYRARREFRTLELLRGAGLACCEPVLWGTGRSRRHGLCEVLVTREIAGVSTLAARAADIGPAGRTAVLGRVYEQLAGVHRAGVYHGAPYLTNVLLQPGADPAGGVILLDLEKSVRFSRDVRGSRMASFDLVNLVTSTFHVMGKGYARPALKRYGLGDDEIARLFATLAAFRSSKWSRYRRRAEFLARGLLSRTAARRPGHASAPLGASLGAPPNP